MPGFPTSGADPAAYPAYSNHSYLSQSVVPNVTEEIHVEGEGGINPNPQDDPYIYGERHPYTIFNSQSQFGYTGPVANSPSPSQVSLTEPPFGNEYGNSIEIAEAAPADLRAATYTHATNGFNAPSRETNLLQKEDVQDYIRSERDSPSDPSHEVTKLSPTVQADQKLTLTHPEYQKLMNFVKKKALKKLIQWIVESNWYQINRKECLPPTSCEFFKIISERPSASNPHSPFSAFISQKGPYRCLLCESKKSRSLERAFGHARKHFNFKPVDGYTDENTKNDQKRREKKQKECGICRKMITVQNFSRHKKVHEK